MLQMYLSSLNNVQATSLLGKTIKVEGDTLTLTDGKPNSTMMYTTDNDGEVTIEIYNENGDKVATKEIGNQSAGDHEFNWDGTDDDGNKLPDGKYSFKVKVTDQDGNETDAKTYIRGEITGVSFKDNVTYLMVNGKEYSLSSILEILNSTQNSDSSGQEGEK